MKKVSIFIATSLLVAPPNFAQNIVNKIKSDSVVTLTESVLSVNRVKEPIQTVPQRILTISTKEIFAAQMQNTADLLAYTGNVFVQKSQMGGGSPVIRGFEANKVLIMVDGVRMNNIIYRGGHLQNVVTIDNSMLDRIELIYGSGSTMYGSDALGGVMSFYTKQPVFANNGQRLVSSGSAFARYGSVNNEQTAHADIQFGGKKWASLTSVTYSNLGDLKGGKTQNPFYDTAYGYRLFYADRINGKDTLVANDDIAKQVYSGYQQYDVLQKIAYKSSAYTTHTLNLQGSTSSNVPRYDRLTDPAGSGLRSAEWYYGPQTRLMAAYDMNYTRKDAYFQHVAVAVNYQYIEESRHNRNFGKTSLNHRTEYVNVAGLHADMQRKAGKHDVRIGLDGQYNMLQSTAYVTNISTGATADLDTRYPDGSNRMNNTAVYYTHSYQVSEQMMFTDGARLGMNTLRSNFEDTTFFKFPYTSVAQINPFYALNAGAIWTPTNKWKLAMVLSTGFRAPNVDDLSKVFESAPGSVIVPNSKLLPEKTYNAELNITNVLGKRIIWDNSLFYTNIADAIVTSNFSYNGADSIVYNGVKSRVLANQNNNSAYITGFSSNLKVYLYSNWQLGASGTYTYGRVRKGDTTSPLDHIPPFYARVSVDYKRKRASVGFFMQYNGAKKLKDYYLNGEDNEQYATKEGMPAWLTFNIRGSYQITQHWAMNAGIDNIMDVQYRAFASGINGPGRNIFGTLKYQF